MRFAKDRGFSLPELLLAVSIVGVLALVALPSYSNYKERTRVAQAVVDISSIGALVRAYYLDNRDYPSSLSDIGANKADPWGQPYVYTVFRTPADRASARKDKNLVPINSDYDLYSKGKDLATRPPLLAPQSRDDVVRASDGARRRPPCAACGDDRVARRVRLAGRRR